MTFSARVCWGRGTCRDPQSRCLRPTEPRAAFPCPASGSASSFAPPRPSRCWHPWGTWLRFQILLQQLSNICLLFGNRNYGTRRKAESLRGCCRQPTQPQPSTPGLRRSKIFLLLQVAFCSRAVVARQGAGARLRGDLAVLRGDLAVLLRRPLLFPAFEHPCALQGILTPLHQHGGAVHVQHMAGSPPASPKDADGVSPPFFPLIALG